MDYQYLEEIKRRQKREVRKRIIIIGSVLFIFILLGIIGSNSDQNKQISVSKNEQKDTKNTIKIREVLETDYFAIKVNNVSKERSVNTGNEFADLKPEDGIYYLILDVSFKNIDSESRMLSEGSIFVNYNGKDYEFDKSEMVMLEGWGLFLDQINPLVTKTTKLVYKIPSEVKGSAYWRPGRANENQVIELGEI